MSHPQRRLRPEDLTVLRPNAPPIPRIGELLDQALGDLLSRPSPPAPPPRNLPPSPSTPPRPGGCHCRGEGTLLTTPAEATAAQLIVVDRYGSSVLVLCPACERGRARAASWSGLPDEARGLSLDALRAHPAQRPAVEAIVALLRAPHGWLTLVGGYGTGKTTLIYAALNHLAAQGVYGRYVTAPGLINHLRDALRDQDGRAHSARLERLKSVPVLAVDELDKYRGTEYAEETIFDLFDHRYRERRTLATLIGYNRERGDRIPPFLASRMRDGRFTMVELDGPDLRPAVRDDPAAVWARGE